MYDYLTDESEYLTDELETAFDLLLEMADADAWEEIPEVSCYIIEKETDRVKLAHIKSIISLYR